eukprot:GHVP01066332.1.p1 GENE.GHVP01066332.1~~GHVP01066332.1.p1  ORF type:complete len:239 (+),score=33.37 GHVP01066332.1:79-795(+)
MALEIRCPGCGTWTSQERDILCCYKCQKMAFSGEYTDNRAEVENHLKNWGITFSGGSCPAPIEHVPFSYFDKNRVSISNHCNAPRVYGKTICKGLQDKKSNRYESWIEKILLCENMPIVFWRSLLAHELVHAFLWLEEEAICDAVSYLCLEDQTRAIDKSIRNFVKKEGIELPPSQMFIKDNVLGYLIHSQKCVKFRQQRILQEHGEVLLKLCDKIRNHGLTKQNVKNLFSVCVSQKI